MASGLVQDRANHAGVVALDLGGQRLHVLGKGEILCRHDDRVARDAADAAPIGADVGGWSIDDGEIVLPQAEVHQRLEVGAGEEFLRVLGRSPGIEDRKVRRDARRDVVAEVFVADREALCEARAALRKVGLRFGAYHIYLPALLKPAPRALAAQLWALKHGGIEGVKGLDEVPHLAASGRTSFAADKDVPKGLYLAAGFRVSGERAVRVDILERLADLVRPAIAYRPGVTPGEPPPGAADGEGFVVTVAMTSLAGCSGEAFASILKSLGYMADKRPGPPITVALVPMAPREPIKQPVANVEASGSVVADADAETSATTGSVADPAADSEPAVEAPVADVAEETVAEGVAETSVAEPTPAAAADSSADPAAPVAAEPVASHAVPEDGASATASPVGEDVATTTAAAEPEVAADVAEPVLIEVWRPHRQHNQGNRRPERSGADRPNDRNQGRGAERGPRRPHHNRGAQPGVAADGSVTPVAGAVAEGQIAPSPTGEGAAAETNVPRRFERPAGGAPRHSHGGRPDNRGGKGRPEGSPGEGRPGGFAGGNRGGRGPDDRRQDDRRPAKGGGDRTFASTERPAPRERQPDPNSPFAKLLSLKAELEAKGKKD